mgnify:CR=1 FL=1
MTTVETTYYAGAADRLGTRVEAYEGVDTAEELLESIVARHGERVRPMLASCAFLTERGRVDGNNPLRPVGESAAVGGETVKVDVLPPFAGG